RVRVGDGGLLVLQLQPFLNVGGQDAPVAAVLDHGPDAVGQRAGHGEFRAAPGGDLRVAVLGVGDQGVHAGDGLEGPDLTGEDEGVAGNHGLEIALLGLADLAAADQALAPARGDPDVEGGGGDDGADVHAVALGGLGVAHLPAALPVADDAGEAFVGPQGIAAGGDQIDDLLELFPGQAAIGAAGDDLSVEVLHPEGFRAG